MLDDDMLLSPLSTPFATKLPFVLMQQRYPVSYTSVSTAVLWNVLGHFSPFCKSPAELDTSVTVSHSGFY
jgi:hypothetical protein